MAIRPRRRGSATGRVKSKRSEYSRVKTASARLKRPRIWANAGCGCSDAVDAAGLSCAAMVCSVVIDDGVLRTENPLAPHATATPVRQGPGDTLVLDFPDSPAVLLREQDHERGW